MNVSACLVTRGDHEEGLQQIIESLPHDWEIVIWDNGERMVSRSDGWAEVCSDLSVYGRYAAIEFASHECIYVQDDDVIVSDPQSIVDAWEHLIVLSDMPAEYKVVCNMPPEFRPHYPDSALVGFGAAFHRDAPRRAFQRFEQAMRPIGGPGDPFCEPGLFNRRADNVFTVLTPRVLVDVPKTDLPYASDDNRMWRQASHVGERDRMIELTRQVRDGR